jgi:O-antigen/teichoic acid export membrane protein
VSRILQPENIGKINFGNSFVGYFSLIASLGITTYAIRECSVRKNNKVDLSRTASEIYSINICTTIIAYVAMAISLVFFRRIEPYRDLIVIQSLVIVFQTLGADWLNSAMEDFAYITIRTVIFQVLSLLLIFLLVKHPEDYMIYAAITVFSSSGANILNVFYRKKYCKVKFTSKMRWNKHFNGILLLFVMILAQTIFNSADITMLGIMKGNFEVGLYSTAVKISNIIAQIVSSLAWVVMPRMSQYFSEGDYTKINDMLRKILSVLLTLGLPCAIGGMFLSKEIILIIAGEEYIAASSSLCILMISLIFSLVGGSFLGNMVLLPSKREKTYMTICCVATLVNLVLNYFLIPIGGASAASGTTAFAAFMILLMLLLTVDKRIHIYDMKNVVLPPVIGSIYIAFCCGLVHKFVSGLWITTFMAIAFSVVGYIVIQLILKNEILIETLNPLMRKLLGIK